MRRAALVLILLALSLFGIATPSLSQGGPEFKLGFKALADQIPAVVGDSIENEHWGDNGDSLQQTTTGLMVWRKADNWTAFTNGSRTWINGPEGVQSRLNGERFPWEEAAGAQPARSLRRVGGLGQYATLQAALDAAEDGDIIQVARGTYAENLGVHRPRSLRIQGGWSADFAERSTDNSQTVIDGRGSGPVFDVAPVNGVALSLALEGLTIRNGRAPMGGGIKAAAMGAGSRANLTLTNVSIVKNSSSTRGGGLYLYGLPEGSIVATITDSTIADNSTFGEGGGLRVESAKGGTAEVQIDRSVISRNVSTAAMEGPEGGAEGGGLAAYASPAGRTKLTVTNSRITENSAKGGGAILGYPWGTGALLDVTLTNNIIAGNRAQNGGAIFCCAGVTDPLWPDSGGSAYWRLTNNTITGNTTSEGETFHFHSGSTFGDGGLIDLSMRNDILWGNDALRGSQLAMVVDPGRAGTATATAAYSDIGTVLTFGGGVYRSDHVVQVDPQFVAPSQQDLRLRDGSPVVDAGDPNPSYNDGRRPPGKGAERNDMGAYGGPKNGENK